MVMDVNWWPMLTGIYLHLGAMPAAPLPLLRLANAIDETQEPWKKQGLFSGNPGSGATLRLRRFTLNGETMREE